MARGTKAQKEAKRRIVAKGVVAGQPLSKIAREAKTSKRHVERLAAEEATQIIITELFKPHRDRLVKIVDKSITAVEQGLTAKIGSKKPDHVVRLRAVGRARQVLEMAEGTRSDGEDSPAKKFNGTMEELLVLYRKTITTEGGGPPAEAPAPR